MYIAHWAQRTIVAFVVICSWLLFEHLMGNTNVSNSDDISGSIGLKVTVFFVVLISTIAYVGVIEDYWLFTQLRNKLSSFIRKGEPHSFMLDEEQQALITYNFGSFRIEITFTSTLQRTIYIVSERSFEIYQTTEFEIPAHLAGDRTNVATAGSGSVKVAALDYRKKMKILIRALEKQSYQ